MAKHFLVEVTFNARLCHITPSGSCFYETPSIHTATITTVTTANIEPRWRSTQMGDRNSVNHEQ